MRMRNCGWPSCPNLHYRDGPLCLSCSRALAAAMQETIVRLAVKMDMSPTDVIQAVKEIADEEERQRSNV